MLQAFPSEWDLLTKINYLQRKIILNSILYYEYDTSNISDSFYDGMCKQLVEYHHIYNRRGDYVEDSNYGYVYYDFNGSTGFHLYGRLNEDDRQYLDMITRLFVDNKKGRVTWQ